MARVTNKFSLAAITFHQSAVASTSKHPPENWLRSEMAYSRRKWDVISFGPPPTASRDQILFPQCNRVGWDREALTRSSPKPSSVLAQIWQSRHSHLMRKRLKNDAVIHSWQPPFYIHGWQCFGSILKMMSSYVDRLKFNLVKCVPK